MAELAELLVHADWLRSLARRLVADPDDAVQDTFVVAMHSPPDPELPPRPWLARVLVNITRMSHRSATRRERREQALGAVSSPAVDDTVARAETFRLLVDLVLALAEPYRSTLIRHYFDGDSLAEIARRDKLPEATVRGRHKHALAQLRAKLDARGERSAWMASLAPLTAPKPALVAGALVMNKILITAAVALVAGGLAWKLYPRAPAQPPAIALVATPKTPTPTAASITLPPKHVQQLASAERDQLAQRIGAAQLARAEARRVAAAPTEARAGAAAPHEAEMDTNAIRGAMREVVPFLSECYEQNRASLHADHLAIHAHFTMTGDPDVGMVIDAQQLADDATQQPLPATLDDCLRSTLQTLELPPIGDGETIEVTYPLLFSDAPPDEKR